MTAVNEASPYADAADNYAERGWTPIPLPPGSKFPPPPGTTGAAPLPDAAMVAEWKSTRPDANVALRLPEGVVGLDVDETASLGALEARLGPLPATVASTSRADGSSGIRLYRVPPGMRWPSQAGPDIEIVRQAHRYAVAAPSIHPEGREYRWITTDTGEATDLPRVEELPELPSAWVQGLTGGANAVDRTADVDEFLSDLEPGEPTPDVREALQEFDAGLDNDRHRAALRVVDTLAVAGAGGAPGVPEALALALAPSSPPSLGVRQSASGTGCSRAPWRVSVTASCPSTRTVPGCCSPCRSWSRPRHGLSRCPGLR